MLEMTTNAGTELDDIFKVLKNNFSDSTDYIKMLVKVFSQINNQENKHLRLFYLILPSLTINYVENMMISKERL
jgi:WASH complex subunit 7